MVLCLENGQRGIFNHRRKRRYKGLVYFQNQMVGWHFQYQLSSAIEANNSALREVLTNIRTNL